MSDLGLLIFVQHRSGRFQLVDLALNATVDDLAHIVGVHTTQLILSGVNVEYLAHEVGSRNLCDLGFQQAITVNVDSDPYSWEFLMSKTLRNLRSLAIERKVGENKRVSCKGKIDYIYLLRGDFPSDTTVSMMSVECQDAAARLKNGYYRVLDVA